MTKTEAASGLLRRRCVALTAEALLTHREGEEARARLKQELIELAESRLKATRGETPANGRVRSAPLAKS